MEFGISDDEKKRLIEDASDELDKLKKKSNNTMKDVEQIIPKDFVDGT